ncbi:MAG TPA: G1 family glutamic endopeptidase [Solirubrobacteraceae bacterium]|jgi:hypothetical protein|nr:G1 family glutamic endopeptidase [Solirubrobacteraceae bacterium]
MARFDSPGHDITRFPVPPDDFDPRTASDDELKDFGFPRRPDQETSPRAFKYWTVLHSRPMRTITPELTPMDPRVRRRIQPEASPDNQQNWAGGVVFARRPTWPAPPVGEIVNAHFRLTVPRVRIPLSPSNAPGSDFLSLATWVGIDGINVPPLVQCGIVQVFAPHAGRQGSLEVLEMYAFVEWWGPKIQEQYEITSFPVRAGDQIAFSLELNDPKFVPGNVNTKWTTAEFQAYNMTEKRTGRYQP